MAIKIFQVDAFSHLLFQGNPAAVCPLEDWLPEPLVQKIAAENNLSETAFFVHRDGQYHLRWFTPTVEVDLCGHATLASAHVLFNHLLYPGEEISFQTRSGLLTVYRDATSTYTMNFPADPPEVHEQMPLIVDGLRATPTRVLKGKDDFVAIFPSEEDILNLHPDFHKLSNLPSRGILASAPGKKADYVCRCFFPQSGVDEDPFTGSAQTTLAPYWADKLGKTTLHVRQLSQRSGQAKVVVEDQRVLLTGEAITFMEGNVEV
jgi:PhzF family phenazine biosynthesis protein